MGQRQSYNSINSTPEQPNIEQSNKSVYYKILDSDTCKNITHCLMVALTVIIVCVGIIGILFLLNIILSILTVLINDSTESVITFLFGKDIYHKYFAVCSATSYNGYTGCYTTTSLYCS